MRTMLGKVRGSGSAKNGTHHWWRQRVTAIGLLPLVVWLLVSLVGLIGSDYIHSEGSKIISLLFINFVCISCGLLAIIAILKIPSGS